MSARDAFLKTIDGISHPSRVQTIGRVWGDCVDFHFDDGAGATTFPFKETAVYLADLYAIKTGKGNGSRAMQAFTKAADDHQVTIYVHASAKDPNNQSRLERFYKRFGFKIIEGALMKREPTPAPRN